MMIQRVDAVVLFVQDRPKCVAFYRDVFGLPETFHDASSHGFKLKDQDLVLLDPSAATEMVGPEMVAQHFQPGRHTLFCTGVENVDATYEALAAKGVTFLKPPKSQSWGRRTAYFADPEGNLWEIWHLLPAGDQK